MLLLFLIIMNKTSNMISQISPNRQIDVYH